MASDRITMDDFFRCTRCGQCCRGFGGTYLSGADIGAIADFLSIDPQRLIDDYCAPSGGRQVLAQRTDGYCIFWDRVCTIHAVKPAMCRRWPFLRSVLVDGTNWRSMASMCPGIRTDVSMDRLRAVIQAYLSAEAAADAFVTSAFRDDKS